MLKNTYEGWLEETVNLFEETETGAETLEWMQSQDFEEAYADGLTPVQVFDKYTKGYFL